MSGRAVKAVRSALGARLRALRKERGLSQEKLGQRSRLSGKFIGEVERGEKSISIDSLHGVAEALEVPMELLVAGLGDRKSACPAEVEQITATVQNLSRRRAAQVLRIVRAYLDPSERG